MTAYLEYGLNSHLRDVYQENAVIGEGGDANELVRVVVQRQVVVLRVSQTEEHRRVGVRIASQIARDNHVIAVCKKRAQNPAIGDVDQGGVLSADVGTAVLRLFKVVLFEEYVVDVETSGETEKKGFNFIYRRNRNTPE